MLALQFRKRNTPVLWGERVVLRVPEQQDYAEWAALRSASRAFLEPWEPRWTEDELERGNWRLRVQRYKEDFSRGAGITFFIFEKRSGSLVGGITIGNIRHGVAKSAQLGYWMGERFAGKGMMMDAVNVVVQHSFGVLGLHRVEAACIPRNERSIRVLEKAKFRREGLLRSYLRINGAWQDHYLYALIEGDIPTRHSQSARLANR